MLNDQRKHKHVIWPFHALFRLSPQNILVHQNTQTRKYTAGASFAARVFAESSRSSLIAKARNHPLESPALQGLQVCEASLHLQRGL